MARFMVVGTSVALLAAIAPVAAEEDLITGLQECRQITEGDERLACYDALAAEFGRDTGETAQEAGSEAAAAASRDQGVTAAPAETEGGKSAEEAVSPSRQTGHSDADPEVAPDEPEAGTGAPDGSRAQRVRSADDLSLPHRTRIESFASNRRGDYRFRIGEGIVFERAAGPGVPSADLTGAAVTLSKNFMGQWRARVEGQARELWVRPVRR